MYTFLPKNRYIYAFFPKKRYICALFFKNRLGLSAGAMVLGKIPVPVRPTIWMIEGQGPVALAVGASGGCLGIFILLYLFSPLSSSLGNGPMKTDILSQKAVLPETTNQQTNPRISISMPSFRGMHRLT